VGKWGVAEHSRLIGGFLFLCFCFGEGKSFPEGGHQNPPGNFIDSQEFFLGVRSWSVGKYVCWQLKG
jgi:hypothetical protein